MGENVAGGHAAQRARLLVFAADDDESEPPCGELSWLGRNIHGHWYCLLKLKSSGEVDPSMPAKLVRQTRRWWAIGQRVLHTRDDNDAQRSGHLGIEAVSSSRVPRVPRVARV